MENYEQVYDDSIYSIRPFFTEILDDIGISECEPARGKTLTYLYYLAGTCEGIKLKDLNMLASAFYEGFTEMEIDLARNNDIFVKIPVKGIVKKNGRIEML